MRFWKNKEESPFTRALRMMSDAEDRMTADYQKSVDDINEQVAVHDKKLAERNNQIFKALKKRDSKRQEALELVGKEVSHLHGKLDAMDTLLTRWTMRRLESRDGKSLEDGDCQNCFMKPLTIEQSDEIKKHSEGWKCMYGAVRAKDVEKSSEQWYKYLEKKRNEDKLADNELDKIEEMGGS